MALSQNGTVSYNGIVFSSNYRSKITARPIRDEAERTTIYVEYTLEIDAYVQSSTGNDPTMGNLRKRLTQQGAGLVFTGKGFADVLVNAPNLVQDAKWGPVPEVLEWTPLGDVNAALVKWRVVWRVPECDSATYKQGILAVNYEVDYDIDGDGYTTITTTGYLEIPMTRITVGNRALPDTADNYREKVVPPVPLGFKREQHFKLSKDKRREDFQIKDTQIPAALPPYVTNIDARQAVSSNLKLGFNIWTVSFDVTLTVTPGMVKVAAFDIFLFIVRKRLAALRKNAAPKALLPQEISVEEDIFGKETRFHLVLRDMTGRNLRNILSQSGMWQPVSNGYDVWRTSLANLAYHPRGYSRIKHLTSEDAIIDLCTTSPPKTISPTPDPETNKKQGGGPGSGPPSGPGHWGGGTWDTKQQWWRRVPPQQQGNGPGFQGGGDWDPDAPPPLDPESSWWRFRIRLRLEEDPKMRRHQPTPKPPDPNLGGQVIGGGGTDIGQAIIVPGKIKVKADGSSDDVGENTGGMQVNPGFDAFPPDVFHRDSAPVREFTLLGDAVRAGFRIPAPALVELGGQPVLEMYRVVEESEIGAIAGVPIYALSWAITYTTARPPQGVLPTLGNPVLDTNGGAGK